MYYCLTCSLYVMIIVIIAASHNSSYFFFFGEGKCCCIFNCVWKTSMIQPFFTATHPKHLYVFDANLVIDLWTYSSVALHILTTAWKRSFNAKKTTKGLTVLREKKGSFTQRGAYVYAKELISQLKLCMNNLCVCVFKCVCMLFVVMCM